MSRETQLEFVIQDAKRLRDYRTVSRIEVLFNVQVILSSAQHSEGEWLTLRGTPEDTAKAKVRKQWGCS